MEISNFSGPHLDKCQTSSNNYLGFEYVNILGSYVECLNNVSCANIQCLNNTSKCMHFEKGSFKFSIKSSISV